MIIKWDKFTETKSNKFTLTKELIEDYFLPMSDKGYKYSVSFFVHSDNQWCDLDSCDVGAIDKVSYGVELENNIDYIKDLSDLEKNFIYIKELYSICDKINKNYNIEVTINKESELFQINFIYNPSLYEACLITYSFLKDYIYLFTENLTGYFNDDVDFIVDGKDYLIEFKAKDIKNKMSIVEFRKIFNIFIKEEFSHNTKYDSIERKGNKYIIKNFISLDDIKFEY